MQDMQCSAMQCAVSAESAVRARRVLCVRCCACDASGANTSVPFMPNGQRTKWAWTAREQGKRGGALCKITHAGGVGGCAWEGGACLSAALRWGYTTCCMPFAFPFLVCGAQAGKDECGFEGAFWGYVWVARLGVGDRWDDVRFPERPLRFLGHTCWPSQLGLPIMPCISSPVFFPCHLVLGS